MPRTAAPKTAVKRVSRAVRTTTSAVESQAPAAPDQGAASQPAPAAMGRGDLARALRAMASELERDPTLARRISEAMRDLSVAPPSSSAQDEQAHASATKSAETTALETKPKRASRAFRPRVVEGTSPALGTGIPDPFALRARLGEAGLRAALAELRLGSLRAIVREHGLDPAGAVVRGNDAQKLCALIIARTAQ